MEFASHLGKKLLFLGLLDVMLYELDMQDPQRNDWVFFEVIYLFSCCEKEGRRAERGRQMLPLQERDGKRREGLRLQAGS